MPKNKQQKKEILNSFLEKIKKAKSVVFVGFNGLTVNESEELRKLCRENDLEYMVAKKTLLKLALKELNINNNQEDVFSQEVAAIFSYKDEVMGAKIAAQFSKDHEALVLKGGILENKIIDLKMVKNLVNIPGKDELYAKIVGSINAPLSGLVNVLAGNLRNLIQVLTAIKEKKS